MKNKYLFGAALFLFLFAACNKMPFETNSIIQDSECTLTVDISGSVTKVTGQSTAAENSINNVSVFVFREDDGMRLDASSYISVSPAATQAGSGNPYSLSLKCTVGERKIYALVNMPSDISADISKESDLLSKTSLFVDNGVSNFFMMGDLRQNLTGADCTVNLSVTRVVSSVRLEKITNLMEAKAYQKDGIFVVNKIYLTNVVGLWKFDGSTQPSALAADAWLAKNAEQNNPLIWDGAVNTTVNFGSDKAYKTQHCFYAYPNDCELVENATWTPRSTMLVVEATLNGTKYYYPVKVGPLERNRQYVITDFVIRRPGSLSPYLPVHKTVATINISVNDWNPSPINTTEEI